MTLVVPVDAFMASPDYRPICIIHGVQIKLGHICIVCSVPLSLFMRAGAVISPYLREHSECPGLRHSVACSSGEWTYKALVPSYPPPYFDDEGKTEEAKVTYHLHARWMISPSHGIETYESVQWSCSYKLGHCIRIPRYPLI
jgi:hypothetical protein